ncbi:growth/differentiation factor 8, partial [Manduca sexta]
KCQTRIRISHSINLYHSQCCVFLFRATGFNTDLRESPREIQKQEKHTRRHSHFKGLKVINFRFTDKVLQNELDEAVLNLHVQELDTRNTTSDPEEFFSINIQVSRVTRHNQGSKASVPYTDNTVKLSRRELKLGKWLKANVTTMVAEFCRLPRENLAIVVRVQDSRNRMSLVVPHPSSESNNALMPYIEVSLKDNSHKRTRRTVGMDCTENSKEIRCCRYPLVVNFEEFGWDWIIAPKVYNANYCSGECPYSFLQKYPHTHLVHLAAPQGSGGPCCAPRRMSSITMLYFDHDYNIIYGTIPGMVVESCGCS